MKILIIGMSSNPGGIESYIMSVFRSLRDDKDIFFYFLSDSGKNIAYFDEIISNNGKIIDIKKPKMEKHLSELLWKVQVLNSNSFDIIHVNALTAGNIDWIRLASVYKKHIKLIIHSHNSNSPLIKNNKTFSIKNWIWNRNKIWLDRHPNVIKLAASKEAGQWMFGTSENVNIIPNSIDVDKFLWSKDKYLCYRDELHFSLDEKIILVPSRIAEQKNYSKILSIFKSIITNQPGFRLVIAGGGNQKQVTWLLNTIADMKLNNSVCYLGVRNDMHKIMIASDIMLMPSLYEGLGISALESQAAGLRTYLSKGVIPSEVKVSRAATFVPLSDSSKEWAELIIKDSESILDRKQCNMSVSKSMYSIDNLLKKMQSVYYGKRG
ncbi:hypothetical protein BMS97_00470 [Leuconostoc mesenteroides subsp. mesenteroides]|uniref:glycosyltransferase n=1 Tax=Leuconostoc mesenteroides TaxID=1245 RepID=UPI0009FE8B76|nr:glycosyltransferase [Leuconostoc mesenteroides]ARN63884.1 hypothetical protein A0F18_07505 [Leuconostoc mesenteroides subsp. mesenteroides]MDV8927385.1 glycosyltransferase [Leuconostoc mesenteroides]ORI91171.1 hypothetical protein BMS97_00470 [Leuconostoc mesenteroides subsp. mesenteroides]ORI92848.1 hypothetical protein BMS98_03400 [Leuconostoc mesenteroides subsp. mesenteroides]